MTKFGDLGIGCGLVLWLLSVAVSPAQTLSEPMSVYLNVSNQARKRLRTVDVYIRDQQWDEVIEHLQGLIETQGESLVPAGPGCHMSVRAYCHLKLSQLPAEGLGVYRERVDSQAKDLLQRSKKTGRMAPLRRITEEFFCSSVGDEAAERLGDWAFSAGRYFEAISWWSKILPSELMGDEERAMQESARLARELRLHYPDPKNDLPRLAAKWIIAKMLTGQRGQASQAAEALRSAFPDARGDLAGHQGLYWEIAAKALDDPNFDSPQHDTDWPTFAGNYLRTRNTPRQLQIAGKLWEWTFLTEKEKFETDPRNQDSSSFFRPRPDEKLLYHPVSIGHQIFLVTHNRLRQFNLQSGQEVFWEENLEESQVGIDQNRQPGTPRHTPRYTLTVSGDRLLVRVVRTSGKIPSSRRRQGGKASTLYCFQISKQKLLWKIESSELTGEQNLVFEGSPIVRGNSVYIAITHIDTISETSVVCLDLEDGGKLVWRTPVCETTSDSDDDRIPLHNLLTLADDKIFYCTNLGAVACLDAQTGKLRWVATYPSGNRFLARHTHPFTPDLNPCVYAEGMVFVAARDTSKLQCFDAQTGSKLWEAHPAIRHILGVSKGNLIVTGNRVWGIAIRDEGRFRAGSIRWEWPPFGTAPGHGRGLIAGDLVYWPTKTEIHVLDPTTGYGHLPRPSIKLWQDFGMTGGNLIVADEYLILTQQNRLYALAPYRRLKQKHQLELEEDPTSAQLHMQLAQMALTHEDYDLARQHFQLAAEYAGPAQIYDGRPLETFAHEKQVEALTAKAQRLAKDDRFEEADEVLEQALDVAPSGEIQLRTLARVAEMWSAADRPERSVAHYQAVICDENLRKIPISSLQPPASSLQSPIQDVRIPAWQWASRRIRDLLEKHGQGVYAKFENEALSALARTSDTDRLLALADRYPNATGCAEQLLDSGWDFETQRRFRDALLVYKRLLRCETLDSTIRLEAMAGLERTYRTKGFRQADRMWLERLAREYPDSPMPRNPGKTVAQFVRASSRSIDHNKKFDQSDARRIVVRRSWTRSTNNGTFAIPSGTPASEDWQIVSKWSSGKLTCSAAGNGEKLWQIDFPHRPLWLVQALGGLLVGTSNRLSCLELDSGKILWKHEFLDLAEQWRWARFEEDASGVIRTESQGPLAPPASSLQPPASSRFALLGDLVIVLGHHHRLWAIEADDGSLLWEVLLDPEYSSPVLQLVGQTVCLRLQSPASSLQPSELIGLDARTGKRRFEVPLAAGVTDLPLAQAGGRILAATARDTITAIDPVTGESVWNWRMVWPSIDVPHLYGHDDQLLVLIDGCQLARLEPLDGKVVWHRGIETVPTVHPQGSACLTGECFIYVQQGWLECRLASEGKLAWRRPLPETKGEWNVRAIGPQVLVYAGEEALAHLLVWEISSGRLSQSLRFENPGTAPTFSIGDFFVLLNGSLSTWALSLDGEFR